MDAVRLQGEMRARAELVRQGALDQFTPLAAALRRSISRRHGDAAFFPVDVKPGLAALARRLPAPANCDTAVRLFERAVFGRVRGQLMQSQGEDLHRAGTQAHALRTIERNTRTGAFAARLRGEFGLQKLIEGDALVVLDPRQQALHAAERGQALAKARFEIAERRARAQGPIRDRLDHADEIARAMLQLADQDLQPLLAFAQRLDSALAVGDVPIDADDFEGLAVLVVARERVRGDPANLAVRPDDAKLAIQERAFGRQAGGVEGDQFEVVGMNERQEEIAVGRDARFESEQRVLARVPLLRAAVQIVTPCAHAAGFERDPGPFFAFAKHGLGFLALGNVENRSDHARSPARLALETDLGGDGEPAQAAARQ